MDCPHGSTISSGREAIEEALSQRPDVILMNILLDDGMSGGRDRPARRPPQTLRPRRPGKMY